MEQGRSTWLHTMEQIQIQIQILFIWSYCRPRRPLLRPNLVAVAEATWKKIKYTVYMYVQIIVIIK